MKMEFYEEFVILAETGSFSKAAEQLPFTQAALTQHVQQMEEILGVRLFDRSTRKVELSEAGKLILPHARKIVKLRADAMSAVRAQLAHTRYDLSIGFYPAAARYNFLGRIQHFQALHPEISLQYRELLPEQLVKSMDEGEFDFIVQEERDTVTNPEYDRLCLNRDTLAVAVPAGHPLAAYREALLTQLAREKFHMLPEHTFVYRLAYDVCREMGFTPSITYTSYSIQNILEMVSQGSGVALLMKTPAQKYNVPGVTVLDLTPPITSSVNLLYHENALGKHGQTLLNYMQTQRE